MRSLRSESRCLTEPDIAMKHSNLAPILSPDSIAIIGASNSSTKRGNMAMRALLEENYPGKIYAVNPRESTVLGQICYPSVEALPNKVDMALICTPASTLPNLVETCGKAGIKGVVVLAGGFGESGIEGQQLEQTTLNAAKKYGVRIVGPNTSGIFNTHKSCNLAGFNNLVRGDIGLLTQSGNMALSMVTEAQTLKNAGFSTYIGVGNEADIQFDEYLDYFAEDENTKVVIAYIEGLKNGIEFLKSAARFSSKKPLLVFKSGRTQTGQESARSHTGALAGSYQVARDLMRQQGVTMVDRTYQILQIASALSSLTQFPDMRDCRVAILADGGGHATIAADALVENGFELPALSEHTQNRLRNILPATASTRNPIDVAGATDSDPSLFADCLDTLLDDENIDAVIMVGLFGGYHIRFSAELADSETSTAEALANLIKQHNKPVLVHSIYTTQANRVLNCLRDKKIPLFQSIETAVTALTAFADFSRARQRTLRAEDDDQIASTVQAKKLIKTAREDGRNHFFENEGLEFVQEYGAIVPSAVFAHRRRDVTAGFMRLDSVPVAMKIVSRHILHKSDAGGVLLNLSGTAEVLEGWDRIMTNAGRHAPGKNHEGVIMTPMASQGVEVILGISRDPQFGHVLMFGLGGIFVETLKDVAFRALPIDIEEARAMLRQISGYSILKGVRGQPPVDEDKLAELMVCLSDLCAAHSEITEMDLNPVIAHQDGYQIADVRILFDQEAINQ